MRRLATVVSTTALVLAGVTVAQPAAAATGSVAGHVYDDANRSGTREAGEPARVGLVVQAYDAAGDYVGGSYTDANGRYTLADLPAGTYTVQIRAADWLPLRNDWVPTTTGSARPSVTTTVSGTTTVDFGLRRIVRSTDLAAPVTSYRGPSGLRVDSYNDVVPAKDVHDAIARGTVGAEAASVLVRFDWSSTASTVAGWQGSPGSYSNYNAVCYDTYLSWVEEGDVGVSHEYGHAWSLYYDTVVQQSGTLASYLRARGLEGDPRVNTSYGWDAKELIAEDYRQLLGSPTAAQAPQMNRDLPRAADVPGLREFLTSTFTQPPATSPQPAPQPTAPTLTVTGTAMSPATVSKSGTVTAELSAPATVTVEIVTAEGAPVRTVMSGSQRPAGTLGVVWDRKDSAGRRAKAGSYVAVVTASSGGAVATGRASFSVV